MTESHSATHRFEMRVDAFKGLMDFRVLEILLVASPYDAFVLEEDGQLSELIFEEYRNLDLNLRYAPRLTHCDDAGSALKLLGERPFDMVVATPRLPGLPVEAFTREVKRIDPEMPVGLLTAHAWDLPMVDGLDDGGRVDLLFLWGGDAKSLLAMIKQVEDRRNADHDILEGGVQVIILVEDNVRFYSTYLPLLYTEITSQTSRLIAEGLNLSHRLLRMRARPKILLVQTFEEAVALFERYTDNVLGIISDIRFPREGRVDPQAGLELVRRVRSRAPDVPILLQSREKGLERTARELGAAFLHKDAPDLLMEIRSYVLEHFGFGDFVFRLPDGVEVGRAKDLRELVKALKKAPEESFIFHANANHFSAWLKARTEFEIANTIRPKTADEFSSTEAIRQYLIDVFQKYVRARHRHVIADFEAPHFDADVSFAKLGAGSMGGKGRGLAFLHRLLASDPMEPEGIDVSIPQTVVLASEGFEDFLEENDLRGLLKEAETMEDAEILNAFRRGRFGHKYRADLGDLLRTFTAPLAIRSSGILEDSLYQPFAGVYSTVMIPNSHASLDVRLAQLLEAIKVVYASTYFRSAREYLHSTPFRSEEEKMAVVIQRLVGARHEDRFYPTLSGTASSFNFYPAADQKTGDGVVQIAFGLGKSVVEGFEVLRFCPRHPQVLPQFSAVEDILRTAQRKYYALDMARDDMVPGLPEDANLVQRETAEAVDDGGAPWVVSTYRAADDAIRPGWRGDGTPLITFAPLLKGSLVPIPEILTRFLERAQKAIGTPVEVEFAMDLPPLHGREPVLHFLQVRPMVIGTVHEDADLCDEDLERAVIASERAMGHGRRSTLSDLVVVWPDRFDRIQSARVASALEKINRTLREAGRHYVLVGPGRWGSRDPFLGIPVIWSQISAARAIVETELSDMDVEPSQGSHFFHNLVSFGVSYLTVNTKRGTGRVDWDWLKTAPVAGTALDGTISHIRLESPLEVMVDGSCGRGAIVPAGA
ncbi:MAG: PEP/pyruvate-binding domain-containing protein [Planctomycetota bacterium]|jgi:DNA-binding NarL/FixJ family response regulator